MGGKIGLSFGKGLAKVMGKRLAQKLGIPLQPGEHELRIEIDDQEHSLYWCRCFDQQDKVRSIFRAFGNYADVYLLEKTALIQLILTVDIIDFAWRQRSLVRVFGLPVPGCYFRIQGRTKKLSIGVTSSMSVFPCRGLRSCFAIKDDWFLNSLINNAPRSRRQRVIAD